MWSDFCLFGLRFFDEFKNGVSCLEKDHLQRGLLEGDGGKKGNMFSLISAWVEVVNINSFVISS
jgi:hypothetical protein